VDGGGPAPSGVVGYGRWTARRMNLNSIKDTRRGKFMDGYG